MKPFTIRKATQPRGAVAVSHDDASADPHSKYTIAPNGLGGDRQGQGANGAHGYENQADNATSQLPQEETLLSTEQIAGIQPKKLKAENPWIHDQTHKEFLHNIIVSENQRDKPAASFILINHNLPSSKTLGCRVSFEPSFFTKYYNEAASRFNLNLTFKLFPKLNFFLGSASSPRKRDYQTQASVKRDHLPTQE